MLQWPSLVSGPGLKSSSLEVTNPSVAHGLQHHTFTITSWQIEGEKLEAVTECIFLGYKITVDGDCSHEIKRYLLLKRKTPTILESILKSRDIALPTKVHVV